MPTSIAVIGPGAIGGTIAAWLAQPARNAVTVCARTPFEKLVVEVPGNRTLEAKTTVFTEPGQVSPVDWIITVTKTYDTKGATRWIEHLLGPHTNLAVVQNGVEHVKHFEHAVPRERILPVIIDIPAERSAPGRIRQRRDGDITLPRNSLGAGFVVLFEGTELAPKMTDDFTSAAWRKLALNSAGIVNALTLKPARVVQNEKAAELMRAIAAEAVLVGRAEGATLPDTLPDDVLTRLRASSGDQVNSFLADRLANRRMEIDARNGIIVRLGKRHGIPTPLNEMAVTLLEAALE